MRIIGLASGESWGHLHYMTWDPQLLMQTSMTAEVHDLCVNQYWRAMTTDQFRIIQQKSLAVL